ncbi:MAG: O-antigen ligase family protein [Anaerolineaceae bacterium]|nr:O-antigen ligase family protein [Anaerolineaceae bacterium]
MTTTTSRPKSKGFDLTIQLILAVIVGVALGSISLALSPFWTMAGIAGIVVVLIAIKWPELSILAVIAALCSILPEEQMPVINIGPGRLYMTELILLGLFTVIIVRWLVDRSFKLILTPLDLPLILFYIWAIGTTVIAIVNETVSPSAYIPEIRIVSYYLIFFVVTNLLREKRQVETLVNGFFFLATVVAVAMIYQYTLGTTVPFLSGRVEVLETAGNVSSEITRITDTSGEGIITLAFILKSVLLMTKSIKVQRMPTLVQWVLFGVALIMSFNRTHWAISGMIIIVTALLVRGETRQRLIKWVLIVLYLMPLAAIPLMVMPDSKAGKLVVASIDRVATLGARESYAKGSSTSTVRWRDFEYTYGFQQIQQNPALGLGLGAEYRPMVYGVDDEYFDGRGYTHNAHLWLAVKTGLVGYLLFMWLVIAFISRGFSRWHKVKDGHLRSIVLGTTLAFSGFIIAGILHPIFMTLFWSPLLGMMLGVNEVVYRIEDLT